KDLDGHTHHLSDYRGNVVVLDFWYRGCGWCMQAMPQINQIADDFKGKPVVVLGMNTDTNPADTRFVIDAMKLRYQTLVIDRDAVEKFKVDCFPSLLVIDARGIVRVFDEGYSETLRENMDKKIQGVVDAIPSPASEAKAGK